MMIIKKSILIDLLLIAGVIVMTILVIINKNKMYNAEVIISEYHDSLLLLSNFKSEVLNSFVPEKLIESVNLNELKLKCRDGQEIVVDSLINHDPILVLAFNNECLSCLDKHISTLEESFEGIVICGFKTFRQFIAFDNPFLSGAKSYYVNEREYQRYFGLHEGVLAFIYQKERGSGLPYLHKYEKSALSNKYFSIVNKYLNNITLTTKEEKILENLQKDREKGNEKH